MSKSRKTRSTKTVESQLTEQRKQGMYARATSWSPNGQRNNPRKNRRHNKREMRNYL